MVGPLQGIKRQLRDNLPFIFSGVIPMEIGVLSKRRLPAIYGYTQQWPFFDPEPHTEQSAPFIGDRPRGWGVLVAIEDREPDWVSVQQ